MLTTISTILRVLALAAEAERAGAEAQARSSIVEAAPLWGEAARNSMECHALQQGFSPTFQFGTIELARVWGRFVAP
jgi:hypothetical protein